MWDAVCLIFSTSMSLSGPRGAFCNLLRADFWNRESLYCNEEARQDRFVSIPQPAYTGSIGSCPPQQRHCLGIET